jgi:outer membrane protein OmpA-like peptidoglycan-associated protein
LVAGVVKNIQDNSIITNASVNLTTTEGVITTVITDKNGVYAFNIDCEASYILNVTKQNYIGLEKTFTTSNVDAFQENFDLLIEPLECNQTVSGTVLNKETLISLANVELALYYKNTLVERTYSTAGGVFKFNSTIACNANYEIKAEAEGYLPAFTDITSSKEYNGTVNATLKMDKFQDFVTIRNVKMIKTKPIYFDLNSSKIRKDAAIELNKVVQVLKDNPEIKIEIGSHTDSRAPDTYNMDLSEKRAQSTIQYIVNKGVSANRVSGRGYGETQLINECSNGVKCSKEQHQENRRTEFIIVSE